MGHFRRLKLFAAAVIFLGTFLLLQSDILRAMHAEAQPLRSPSSEDRELTQALYSPNQRFRFAADKGIGIKFNCLNVETTERWAVSALQKYLTEQYKPQTRLNGLYDLYLDYPVDRIVPLNSYRIVTSIDGKITLFLVYIETRNRMRTGFCEVTKIQPGAREFTQESVRNIFHIPRQYTSADVFDFAPEDEVQPRNYIANWYNYEYSVTLERTDASNFTLSFAGPAPFAQGMTYTFRNALAAIPSGANITLKLDSFGGSEYVFAELADELRNRCVMTNQEGRTCQRCLIRTHVGPGRTCGSACVGLYSVGLVKTYSPSARFGFHSAYDIIEGAPTKGMEELLQQWGFAQDWIEARGREGILNQTKMTFFSGDQLRGSGLFSSKSIPKCE